MALTKCNVPSDVIGSLATRAEERGLTAQEFKDKFDEMPEGIKQYINEVLTEEVDAHLAENVTEGDNPHGLIYEEGTFTPELTFDNANENMTYTRCAGRYTITGNLCHFEIDILLSSKGTSTGTARISGLPFVASSLEPSLSFNVGLLGRITYTGAYVVAIGSTGSAVLTMAEIRQGITQAPLNDTNFGDTSYVRISGTYTI